MKKRNEANPRTTSEHFGSKPKDYRRVRIIRFATDAEIVNACEDERLSWDYTDTAQLSTNIEDLPPEAKKARAIAYLIIHKGITLLSAAEKIYSELLEDKDRQILYLEERVDKLYDDKLLRREEYTEFQKNKKPTPKIEALLSNLSLQEAEEYERVANIHFDKRTKKQRQCWQELNSRIHTIELPQALKERMEDLKKITDNFTSEEALEQTAFINLHSVLNSIQDIETRLAVRDFGIQKLFSYILLMTQEEDARTLPNRIIQAASLNLHNLTSEQLEEIQTRADQAYKKKWSDENDQKLKMVGSQMDAEPLIRPFIYNWRSIFATFLQKR